VNVHADKFIEVGCGLIKDSALTYLLVVNASGFLLMGYDKLSAKLNSVRIPEALFFLVSLAGGFAGVLLGMPIFHHKTSKRTFQAKILVAAIMSVLMLFLLGLI